VRRTTPDTGVEITPDVFKFRLAVKRKEKGKSGGMRVFTFWETTVIAGFERKSDTLVFVNLAGIYDKSEVENITLS
jgi:hypothetical protein